MSGKFFGFLLVVVVLVIGVAMVTMTGDSDLPSDPGSIDTPTENTGSSTEGRPDSQPDIQPVPDGGSDTVEPQRETAVGVTEFDPDGDLTITGTVTSARDGAPVVEADVELLYQDGEIMETATTDDEGRYLIEVAEGIPPVVDLRAWGDGFATQSKRDFRISVAERNMTVDFQLRSWFTVEGRVTSAADGAPVADADVEIRALLPMFEDEWDDATTDENGYYRIEEIEDLPRVGFDLWVDSSDHVPMVRSDLAIPEDSDTLRVDFQLWPQLVLRGRVVSAATRQPLEDAEISVSSHDPEFIDDGEDEISDEDGTFELELDAVPYEDMFVLVSAEEHSGVVVRPVPPPDGGGNVNLGDIALPPLVQVSGTVVNRQTGRPVSGGDISAYAVGAPDRDEGDYCDSELIDELGRFQIDLEYTPPQMAEIYIEADDHFPLRQRIQLAANVSRHELRFEVDPVLVLKGVVKRKADGSAVAGARVRLLAPNEGEESMVGRTLADGRYRLDLPAGNTTQFGIVIEYGDKRFPIGQLNRPPAGQFSIQQDFEVDLPPMRRRPERGN